MERNRDSVKSKQDSIKRRVEKYNEERKQYSGEKDDVYASRRKRKQEKKRQIQRDKTLKRYKCLYWPSYLSMFCGCLFTFGATIKSVSEGSVLWSNRETFRIVGPALLGSGFILFLITVAFVSEQTEKVKKMAKEEELKRIGERKLSIRKRYLKRASSNLEGSIKSPVHRTISATSSATCYSIDELESSVPFISDNFSDSMNGNLHPYWKPLVKMDSSESNTSSKFLECSISSSSTLMTSFSSNNTRFSISPGLNTKTEVANDTLVDANEIHSQLIVQKSQNFNNLNI